MGETTVSLPSTVASLTLRITENLTNKLMSYMYFFRNPMAYGFCLEKK